MYLALGVAYVAACDSEKKEAELAQKKKEELRKELDEIDRKSEMDIMFFYYSWYNNIPYKTVMELYEKGEIKIEQLQKCLKDHQQKKIESNMKENKEQIKKRIISDLNGKKPIGIVWLQKQYKIGFLLAKEIYLEIK